MIPNKPFLMIDEDEKGSPRTIFFSQKYQPMELGLLLVDIARHYANFVEGENVLEDIYKGFDMERRRNTTELERIDN